MVEDQIRSYDKIVASVGRIMKEADEERDVKASLKRLSEARARYDALKGVALFMFSYMNTDLQRYSAKAYKKINACRASLTKRG
jgi:hypothetical protein